MPKLLHFVHETKLPKNMSLSKVTVEMSCVVPTGVTLGFL